MPIRDVRQFLIGSKTYNVPVPDDDGNINAMPVFDDNIKPQWSIQVKISDENDCYIDGEYRDYIVECDGQTYDLPFSLFKVSFLLGDSHKDLISSPYFKDIKKAIMFDIYGIEDECSTIDDKEMYGRFLFWRHICPDDGDIVCKECDGSGVKTYGDTSTWMHSIGGQVATSGVCDKCWGSGKTNSPGPNLKHMHMNLTKKKK